MRMLEATHARMPQMAPMMPGAPNQKPIIERMELARRQSRRKRGRVDACGPWAIGRG